MGNKNGFVISIGIINASCLFYIWELISMEILTFVSAHSVIENCDKLFNIYV